MDKGDISPFFNTAWALFFLSYAVAWPQEYRHMKAEQAAKLKGEDGHH